MGKIIVIGSSNTDLVVNSSKLPAPGETLLGNTFETNAGGKGANQAVAAARAGGKVVFVAKVGNDNFGKKAILEYQKDTIDTQYIGIENSTNSGIAVILVDETSGQNSIVVVPGANSKLQIDDIKPVEPEFHPDDMLLVQLEIPIDTVTHALKMAKQKGARTILNPAPAQALSDDLLKLVDIITPNETETALLTGIDTSNNKNIEIAAQNLLKKVNELVIVTLGSEGVYYASKDGANGFIPATKVKAVDTTAAGDVFNGYFAVLMAKKTPLPAAIKMAAKAATLSVTRKGAQSSIPFIDELI